MPLKPPSLHGKQPTANPNSQRQTANYQQPIANTVLATPYRVTKGQAGDALYETDRRETQDARTGTMHFHCALKCRRTMPNNLKWNYPRLVCFTFSETSGYAC